jgi:vancomycin resistance protein YoaR
MQALSRQTGATPNDPLGRKIGFFFIPPIVGLTLVAIILSVLLGFYRAQNKDQIYNGITVWGTDISGKTLDEAQAALSGLEAYPKTATITLVDPATGEQRTFAPADLGIQIDARQTADAAFAIGRSGSPLQRLQDTFQTWYYGREITPIIVFEEAQMDRAISDLASSVERSAVSAAWDTKEDGTLVYTPSQAGRQIDRDYLRQQLLTPVSRLADAEVELVVHNIYPPVYDAPAEAARLQRLLSEPVRFYFQEPLDDLDLSGVTLPAEDVARWVRVEQIQQADGQLANKVLIDENAARNWLAQFGAQIKREPVNARYYFNDDTRELVLVAPHVNGRELDVEATLERFVSQIENGNHAVPIILKEIIPIAHSGATAADLGITELVSESTTWFYGSSDARKHNIARAAANFYGVVVAPGEEFSFNRYLGSISEADGYEVGLIIVGGRTLKGVGGGVCQVSTTLYQSAFWAGFPIVERWEHGYMVGYYNDGEGPGMDATVFSPIVDFRFINNTPHHLLIENYYNTEFESLTFKFYSTSMGRTVEKREPVFENVQPPPAEDVWEYDENLAPGTVEQFDFATEGARVIVDRLVYNADGELIEERSFVSNYIPWPNVYRYGPGVEPGDYSLVPEAP